MKAVAILMEEHRTIERVLAALDAAAQRLARGEPVRPGLFQDAAEFLATFADGIHHRKEEDVLFQSLAAGGWAPEDGPLAVMRHEHAEARGLIRDLREAVQRWEDGDPAAAPRVASIAGRYITLLQDHIAKEDEVLFPMADDALSPEEHARVLQGFAQRDQVDDAAGSRRQALALAAALEQEAASLGAAPATPPR